MKVKSIQAIKKLFHLPIHVLKVPNCAQKELVLKFVCFSGLVSLRVEDKEDKRVGEKNGSENEWVLGEARPAVYIFLRCTVHCAVYIFLKGTN